MFSKIAKKFDKSNGKLKKKLNNGIITVKCKIICLALVDCI